MSHILKVTTGLLLLLLIPLTADARVSRRAILQTGEEQEQAAEKMRREKAIEFHKEKPNPVMRRHLVPEHDVSFLVPVDWVEHNPKDDGVFTMDELVRGHRYSSSLFRPFSEENLEHVRLYFEKRSLNSTSVVPNEMRYYTMTSEDSPISRGDLIGTRQVEVQGKSAPVETYSAGDMDKDLRLDLLRLQAEEGGEYLLYLVASNYSYNEYDELLDDIMDSVLIKTVDDAKKSISSTEKSNPDEPVRQKFTDVSAKHPYQSAIAWGQEQQILQGYPDGSFGPDKTIKRAELLKIIVEAMDVDVSTYEEPTGFIDVDETSWYAPYLRYAKQADIIQGYADNTFKPDSDVNAAEALKMTYKTLQIDTPETEGDWFAPFFSHAKGKQVLFANNLRPEERITRKDVMWIVWKLRQL